jgi:SpoVK/Ycf46/Vps4 family AAA+-type ATPase
MGKKPIPFDANKHATPVALRATWECLNTLPSSQQAILHDIVAHMCPTNYPREKRSPQRQKMRASVLFDGSGSSLQRMAAEVLAKDLNLPLYRVDLSSLVRKHIGETKRNIMRLFDKAEEGGWLLFFDDTDALLGKRTEVNDGHDRYENIEIDFLLQRMEAYAGLVILATNVRNALDDDLILPVRFVVDFPEPDAGNRKGTGEAE